MTPAISLNLALWIWMTVAVAALAGTIALLIMMVRQNEFDWQALGIGFLGWLSGTGLLTVGLTTAGWAGAAVIAWRVLAVLGLLFVLITLAIALFKKPAIPGSQGSYSPPPPRSMSKAAISITILGTLLILAQTILAFRTSGFVETRNQLPAAEPVVVAAASTLDAVSVIWILTLILFGLGALIFLLLFAKSVNRGGAPQIETHWGGIGGGAGGWRMSSSLSYLVVAGVLMLLFSLFLMRFAKREDKTEDKTAAKATATASPTASPSATPKAAPKASPAAEETAPSPKS